MENFEKPSAQKHFCSYIPYIMNKNQIFVTLGVLKFFLLEHSSSIYPDKVPNGVWCFVCCCRSLSGGPGPAARGHGWASVNAGASSHRSLRGGFMIIYMFKMRSWGEMDVSPLNSSFGQLFSHHVDLWVRKNPEFCCKPPQASPRAATTSFLCDLGVSTPAKYWSTQLRCVFQYSRKRSPHLTPIY